MSSPPEPEAQRSTKHWPVWQIVAIALGIALVSGLVGGLIVAGSNDDDSGSTRVCDAASIAADVLPSVVTIGVQGASGAGSGSGEVIRPDGYILTNNHVISAAAGGGRVTVVFTDGTTAPARIVGRDIATDLAVLKVDKADPLPTIEWGDSDEVGIGRPVVALGAPLGLSSTVTTGIVSGLNRSVNVPADNGRTALLVSAIQTDAAINPGNSGGALVDCSGALVGVPTAGATVPNPNGGSSVGNIGIGFAIPSNFAHRIGDELIANGSVSHSSFGLSVGALADNKATGGGAASGLFVSATVPGGAAAQAGIRSGDVIVDLDGSPATSAEQLQALTLTKRPGEVVHVTVLRDGQRHDLAVTLDEEPSL